MKAFPRITTTMRATARIRTSSGRIFAMESVFSPQKAGSPAPEGGMGASLSRLFRLLNSNQPVCQGMDGFMLFYMIREPIGAS